MMAFWPNDSKTTHLVRCNEQGTAAPGVQRISLATGATETIVTGTGTCDRQGRRGGNPPTGGPITGAAESPGMANTEATPRCPTLSPASSN
jgi:hypothetical protein